MLSKSERIPTKIKRYIRVKIKLAKKRKEVQKEIDNLQKQQNVQKKKYKCCANCCFNTALNKGRCFCCLDAKILLVEVETPMGEAYPYKYVCHYFE